MKIGLINSTSSQIYTDAWNGFARFGTPLYFEDRQLDPKLAECDLYVLNGNNYEDRPAKMFAYKSGKPIIHVTGCLFEVKNPTKYVRVNVNGFVNNMATLPDANYDRWDQIKKFFKFKDIFKKREGEGIVFALNAITSPAQFENLEDWLYNNVEKVAKETDQPIYIRQHRKQKKPYGKKYRQMIDDFKVHQILDSKHADVPKNFAATVTYTTTYSVKSLMYGTPTICTHPGNFVYDITKNEPTLDNLSWYPDEDSLTYHYARLANMLWSVEEINSGKCWETLSRYLQSNPQQNYNWIGV